MDEGNKQIREARNKRRYWYSFLKKLFQTISQPVVDSDWLIGRLMTIDQKQKSIIWQIFRALDQTTPTQLE